MDAAADPVVLPLKSVIYATDFSPCSERAGQYASLFARQFGAELVVAHAFTPSQAAMEVETETGHGAKSAQRKDLEDALTAAARRFSTLAFGDASRASALLLDGEPKDRIPRLARDHAPSIVVLGTKGRGRFERGIMGSTADGILRSTDAPSLTVGPHVPDFAPDAVPIQRVLYATDLMPAAARGAAYAVDVAERFNACLDVLHVAHSQEMKDPARLGELRRQFHAALSDMIPQHAEELCDPKELIEAGSAHERILEHVREFKVDLLVLSVHKSSHLWLRERLSGAFHIVAHAPCPVMTIVS
ncbi:MAG: universal stress protein [Terracidiphilus sp.]